MEELEKRFNRILPVPLTDGEIRIKAEELSGTEIVVEECEEVIVDIKVDLKCQQDVIKSHRTSMRKLAHQIQEKSEERCVDCVNHFDFAEGKVGTVRVDTGEVIERKRRWTRTCRTQWLSSRNRSRSRWRKRRTSTTTMTTTQRKLPFNPTFWGMGSAEKWNLSPNFS